MKLLKDYQGIEIRLTEERRLHILEHPEMAALEPAIAETLLKPECVVQSKSDDQTSMYYRYYTKTIVGGKFLCVVVKARRSDPFILTAYLTNKIKKGEVLWKRKE